MEGTLMLNTYTMPFEGSAAVQPQFAPPCAPGIDTVSFNAGGVNSPSLRASPMRFFQVSRSSGVRRYGLMSLTLSRCGANGGGAVGYGWVGHAASPGISLAGTRRSSMGQIGSPVTRSNTYRNPVLPACATTSTFRPFRRTVVN